MRIYKLCCVLVLCYVLCAVSSVWAGLVLMLPPGEIILHPEQVKDISIVAAEFHETIVTPLGPAFLFLSRDYNDDLVRTYICCKGGKLELSAVCSTFHSDGSCEVTWGVRVHCSPLKPRDPKSLPPLRP